jgi:transposase-like protein
MQHWLALYRHNVWACCSPHIVIAPKRSWPVQQKREIVAEAQVAGATISEVARHYGLRPGLLFRWRREVWMRSGLEGERSSSA